MIELEALNWSFQLLFYIYDMISGMSRADVKNVRLIKFLYNEDREVVAEETGNGTITRYIRGLGIISSDSEEAKTYYHYVSDEQGSITHVLSEDAEILNHYSYDAFGNIIEKTEKVENRFCYNGEMLDPITQQYYLRARFYNPVIGRFTQEDTYYGDGLNLYQYCQANPVGYVDPSGHDVCPVVQNHYEQYQEYRKQHPRATAADAYKAVTGKDPLKKDVGKSDSTSNYYNPDGSPIWPPNRGFDGNPTKVTLEPGTLIDRYGYDGGTFVSPKGIPYTERSLPIGTDQKPYTVFEVVKPVEVQAGKIAPWFGEKGGGIQYEFSQKISDLLQQGILRKVQN